MAKYLVTAPTLDILSSTSHDIHKLDNCNDVYKNQLYFTKMHLFCEYSYYRRFYWIVILIKAHARKKDYGCLNVRLARFSINSQCILVFAREISAAIHKVTIDDIRLAQILQYIYFDLFETILIWVSKFGMILCI